MSHNALLYSWLDRSRRQVRLLRLNKSNAQNPGRITGELNTYSMEDAPSFDALSYAWGVDVVADPIIVNGEAVFVTRNLYEGLQNFRHGDHAEYIWIDAICINQRDFAERSHQVTLMRDLFSMARVVHVWLGPSTPSMERTLYVLDRAGRRLSPDFENAGLLPAEIDSVSTEAFESIFANPWWNRLWVVQEVVLAKEPIAHFGADLSIHFSRLLMGIMACFRLRDQSSAEATLPWYMMQLALKFSAPMTAKTSERPHMQLIPDILAAVRDSKVSVRHDRIYGLLGLIPVRLAIEPDYGRRLEHVFTEFTLRVIWHERSLDVLALGGLHGASDLMLPTWVPSYGNPAPYLFRGTSGFDASKALASRPQLGFPEEVAHYVGSNTLSIWAHELGTISFVISAVPEELPTMLAETKKDRAVQIDKLQQRACECVVKLKQTLSPSATVQETAGIMWSALVGATELSDRNASATSNFHTWLFLRGEEKYGHKYHKVLQTLLAAKPCPLFAVSDSSFVGIVSGNAMAGNSLVILAGASTPCVLRQKDSGRFQYVGHTYCIGAMRGEAISAAALRVNGDENNLNGIFSRAELI